MPGIFTRFCSILALAMLFCMPEAMAQDPEHTQFYSNTMFLNPALAGDFRAPELVFSYRNQWPGISGDFVTSTISFDQAIPGTGGGYGFTALNDRSASTTMSTTSLGAVYSQKAKLTRKWTATFGIQLNLTQEYLDRDKLTFNDQIVPGFGFIGTSADIIDVQNRLYPDFSAGMLLYKRDFWIGYAAHHLNEPNKSFFYGNSPLPMKHTIHGGFKLPIPDRYGRMIAAARPEFLYRQQGPFKQLNLATIFTMQKVGFGVQYRGIINTTFRDAVQLIFLHTSKSYTVGYSYDITVSAIGFQAFGAHEINFKAKLPQNPRRRKFEVPPCHYGF